MPAERFTVPAPLGRPTSLLLVVVLPVVPVVLRLMVRPVLESLMFPELSTILVLELLVSPLTADELRDVRPLCADLFTADLDDADLVDADLLTPDLDDVPLVRAMFDRPLADLYPAELRPDLLRPSPA